MAAPPAAVATLRAQSWPVSTLAFHPGNMRLVSGDDVGWCVHWSLVARRPLAIWRAHEACILTTSWLTDDILLTHARDNKLYIWRLDDTPLSTHIPSSPDTDPTSWQKPWLVASVDVNALNYCAAAARWDDGLCTIAVPGTLDSDSVDMYTLLPQLIRKYQAITVPDVKTGVAMDVKLFEDKLIVGYESGHIALFQLAEMGSYTVAYLSKVHSSPVLSIAINPSDSSFISSSADPKIIKHPLVPHSTSSLPLQEIHTKHAGIASLVVRSDDAIFSAACWDGRVRVWSYRTMKLLASFPGGRQDGVTVVRFGIMHAQMEPGSDAVARIGGLLQYKQEQRTRTRHWLAVGGKDGRIGLWDIY
ncbi:WD40 repeat-like protein [Limtongia smithiae]|uniref:WD40 repeat-like protein n=1 Tax=Limtongia smithiae TaxID=1125753 RepID=UPI0034D00D28